MNRFAKCVLLALLVLAISTCATLLEPTKKLPDSQAILFILIDSAGDSYTMGDGSPHAPTPERFSYSFRMSKYEITGAQYTQFVLDGGYTKPEYWTTNGWNYRVANKWDGPLSFGDLTNHPNRGAWQVSWYEAVAFCNWLSVEDGLVPAYDKNGRASLKVAGYRLPTEAEWEYAAAKGSRDIAERIFPYGDIWDIKKDAANVDEPADVGSKSALGGDTPQGLADMGGNLREWCSDNWQEDQYVTSGTDRYCFVDDSPAQPFSVRGGAYHESNADAFRCAKHWQNWQPSGRGTDAGFRIVSPVMAEDEAHDVTAVPLASSGLLDRVLYLDGTGHVEVPYSSSLDITQDLTIEAWVNVESFPDDPANQYLTYLPIISQPNPTSAIGNYLLAVSRDKLVFGFESSTIGDMTMHALVPVGSGWHHVAVVHTFGQHAATCLFLDGVAVAGEWVSRSGNEAPYPNPLTPYLIGRFSDAWYFRGMLDDVRIWRVRRTAEEIQAAMNIELAGNEPGLAAYWEFDEPPGSTTAHDSSPNGNDGAIRGGATMRVSEIPEANALKQRVLP
jgi:formylglycine-generating enzyme required for sulfatase activity